MATRASSSADLIMMSIISTALLARIVNASRDPLDGIAGDLGVGELEQSDRGLLGRATKEGVDEVANGGVARRSGGDGRQIEVARPVLLDLRLTLVDQHVERCADRRVARRVG